MSIWCKFEVHNLLLNTLSVPTIWEFICFHVSNEYFNIVEFHNIAKLGNAIFVDTKYLNIMGPKSKINIVFQIWVMWPWLHPKVFMHSIYLPIIERIIPFQFLDISNNQLDPTISMLTFNIGTIIIPTTQLLLYQAIRTTNCEAQFSSSIFSHTIAIIINIPSQSQHTTFEDQ